MWKLGRRRRLNWAGHEEIMRKGEKERRQRYGGGNQLQKTGVAGSERCGG